MIKTHRILALLVAAGALSASALVTDAFAKPVSSGATGTVFCIRAPCPQPTTHQPKVEHKPVIECIRAPCNFPGRDHNKGWEHKPKPPVLF